MLHITEQIVDSKLDDSNAVKPGTNDQEGNRVIQMGERRGNTSAGHCYHCGHSRPQGSQVPKRQRQRRDHLLWLWDEGTIDVHSTHAANGKRCLSKGAEGSGDGAYSLDVKQHQLLKNISRQQCNRVMCQPIQS